MIKHSKKMVKVVGGRGSVAEQDDSFVDIGFGEQKDVEVVLLMSDGCLDIHLFQRRRNSQCLRVNLTHEYWLLSRLDWHVLESSNFWSNSSSKQKRLSLSSWG